MVAVGRWALRGGREESDGGLATRCVKRNGLDDVELWAARRMELVTMGGKISGPLSRNLDAD